MKTINTRETIMRTAFSKAEPSAPPRIAGLIRRKLKTNAGVVSFRKRK